MKKTILLSVVAAGFLLAEEAPVSMNIEKQGVDEPVVATKSTMTGDTATILNNTPGVSMNTGGGISSLPAIHGLADDRLKIDIDGMNVTSACPNHMNPALSYVDPNKVAVMEAIAGVTPVSQGGDSIGGSIIVKSKDSQFSKNGSLLTSFETTGFYKSNNHDRGLSATGTVANDKLSFTFSGMAEKANDYKDGNGNRVKDTLFQQENKSASLAYKLENGVVKLEVGHQQVPYEGFTNQYMDMLSNQSTYENISYNGKVGSLTVDANAFKKDTSHYMNKIYYYDGDQINVANTGYAERGGTIGVGMPMNTKAVEEGYKLVVTIPFATGHDIKLGTDLDKYTLNDWWSAASTTVPGGMAPFTIINLNNVTRDVYGFFAEDIKNWDNKLSTNFGARINIVNMNTGDVHGYNYGAGAGLNGGVGITAAQVNDPIDANAFNALDHSKRDVNLDLTAIIQYKNSSTNDLEFGFAQKTRSPSLYERYTWAGGYGSNPLTSGPIAMDMAMVNWFGDGNGYVGNINLKPEIAYTASASSTWHDVSDKEWKVKVTPYYTFVKDYIDADYLGKATTGGYNGIKLFRFANHDAVLFGGDLSAEAKAWSSDILGKGKVVGSVSYTRGYRTDDSGSGLYHIMPLNAKMSVIQEVGHFTNTIDIQAVGSKTEIDNNRNEPVTPGYALVDLKTNYKFSKNVIVDFAITNLFDKAYALPLGGIDVVDYSKTSYTPLAGMGRSFNTAVTIKF